MLSMRISKIFHKYRTETPDIRQPTALRGKLRAFVDENFSDDRAYSLYPAIDSYLFEGEQLCTDLGNLQGSDDVYVRNLLRIRQIIAGNSEGSASSAKDIAVSCGKAEDFLQNDSNNWGLLKALNFALLLSTRPTKKVAIVTSVRNEGMSILEWIAYHRAIGFSDFYVYSNNNTDGSLSLLRVLQSCGIINLIENEVAENVAIQRKVFEHSVHLLPALRDYEWVFYIDVDEFFVSKIGPRLGIDDFLSAVNERFKERLPAAICLNWKWYGSQNVYSWSEMPVIERFLHCKSSAHVKSLVRLDEVVSMSQVHVPVLFNGSTTINSNFDIIAPNIESGPVYGSGQLNHYWNKSFEEFVIKRDRGRISAGLGSKKLDFSTFFAWGANSELGDYAPMSNDVLERTRREYQELSSDRRIHDQIIVIRQTFCDTLAKIDRELDLRSIYHARGEI